MKPRLVLSFALSVLCLGLSSCKLHNHGSDGPATVTITLGGSDALPRVKPGDRLSFVMPGATEFWVLFAGKSPCENNGRLFVFNPRPSAECVIKKGMGEGVPYAFSSGRGKPPQDAEHPAGGIPIPDRAIECKPGCPD